MENVTNNENQGNKENTWISYEIPMWQTFSHNYSDMEQVEHLKEILRVEMGTIYDLMNFIGESIELGNIKTSYASSFIQFLSRHGNGYTALLESVDNGKWLTDLIAEREKAEERKREIEKQKAVKYEQTAEQIANSKKSALKYLGFTLPDLIAAIMNHPEINSDLRNKLNEMLPDTMVHSSELIKEVIEPENDTLDLSKFSPEDLDSKLSEIGNGELLGVLHALVNNPNLPKKVTDCIEKEIKNFSM